MLLILCGRPLLRSCECLSPCADLDKAFCPESRPVAVTTCAGALLSRLLFIRRVGEAVDGVGPATRSARPSAENWTDKVDWSRRSRRTLPSNCWDFLRTLCADSGSRQSCATVTSLSLASSVSTSAAPSLLLVLDRRLESCLAPLLRAVESIAFKYLRAALRKLGDSLAASGGLSLPCVRAPSSCCREGVAPDLGSGFSSATEISRPLRCSGNWTASSSSSSSCPPFSWPPSALAPCCVR